MIVACFGRYISCSHHWTAFVTIGCAAASRKNMELEATLDVYETHSLSHFVAVAPLFKNSSKCDGETKLLPAHWNTILFLKFCQFIWNYTKMFYFLSSIPNISERLALISVVFLLKASSFCGLIGPWFLCWTFIGGWYILFSAFPVGPDDFRLRSFDDERSSIRITELLLELDWRLSFGRWYRFWRSPDLLPELKIARMSWENITCTLFSKI